VLYRLTEPGEVVSAGGSALTLVDLGNVYMEIFLPSNQAAALKIGAEGRIVMDYLPDWAVPASVCFVSPEAQFTPKQVETENEREMLMFRVRLQIPHELVLHYVEQIKTGVRGIGYVKIDESAQWPKRLQMLLTEYQGK
jgi:HlyD family secretion protein